MDNFDVAIIGSGINWLVCAAMLVRKSKRLSARAGKHARGRRG